MNHENKTSAIESFKTDSIPKIVIKNSIPALIAMIMVILAVQLISIRVIGLTMALNAMAVAGPEQHIQAQLLMQIADKQLVIKKYLVMQNILKIIGIGEMLKLGHLCHIQMDTLHLH